MTRKLIKISIVGALGLFGIVAYDLNRFMRKCEHETIEWDN